MLLNNSNNLLGFWDIQNSRKCIWYNEHENLKINLKLNQHLSSYNHISLYKFDYYYY